MAGSYVQLIATQARISAAKAQVETSRTIYQQAADSWAYVDDFRYLALLCALCIPIAFFFKKPAPGAKGAG